MEQSKLKHDFINNGLRIEIVNKIISESLDNRSEVDPELLNDLKSFLEKHIEYISLLQKN